MNIEELRNRRGYIKGKLTRIANYVDEVANKKLAPTREDLLVRLEKLDAADREFQGVMEKLIESSQGHVLSPEDTTEQEKFESRYYEIKAVLNRWCDQLKPESASKVSKNPITETPSTLERVIEQQAELLRQLTTQQAEGQPIANIKSRVRLPVINLPTFDGKVEEWKRFSDSFKTVIHDSELPKVQKHQYLVGALSGSAAKAIEAIEISEQNYEVAWNILRDRFDNNKTLRRRHIQCLFEMPRVDKESAASIQNLIDHTQKHLRILKSLQLPTDSWDELILFMMEDKLDKVTRHHWEESIEAKEKVSIDMMMGFLQRRCQLLERMTSTNTHAKESNLPHKAKFDTANDTSSKSRKKDHGGKPVALVATSHVSGRCYLCNGPHFIYSCEKFLKLSIDDRIAEVKRLKLCSNCLKNDHFVKSCRAGSCRECSSRHNTLCHKPADGGSSSKDAPSSEAHHSSTATTSPAVHHVSNSKPAKYILLSTAIVNATHANGSIQSLRVLLDSASEASFITRSACNRLGATLLEFNESISGLNDMSCKISHFCQTTVNSRLSNYQITAQCLVVPKITKELPGATIDVNSLAISSTIKLADPQFSNPGQIDMLLGGEFFLQLLDQGRIDLGTDLPTLQNTKLGWIVSGPVPSTIAKGQATSLPTVTAMTLVYDQGEGVIDQLTKFWEIDECKEGKQSQLSNEEKLCEDQFQKTVSRDRCGRFVVRLPFRENKPLLGESRTTAEKRLIHLERKFKSNDRFRKSYVEFMKEYVELGHMTVAPSGCRSTPTVYLPHHGVLQDCQGRPKLRVVFDASAKTSSGSSLNDILMVGATLQDLFDIVLRFRLHPIVMTADIQKMYRQINVNEVDRDYQRILWRFSPDDHVQEYQLNTVTYGESCAPFLAIRCVRQLAIEEAERYEQASRALLRDLYVDDILTGVNNMFEATILIEQLQGLLSRGQFCLHKWKFNRVELAAYINESSETMRTRTIASENKSVKTLGLEWDPTSDTFQFKMQLNAQAKTKRELLSAISKLFDPLGIVSPIIVRAKILMQETWRANLEWDDELPDRIQRAWDDYMRDLENSDRIHVPRYALSSSSHNVVNLHAFCDASEKAYGACVYVQTVSNENESHSMLLCARSRVAPVKKLTIPKLELCGAVLLVNVIDSVKNALQIEFNSIHAWTDSTIVLAWISGDVSRQKTFVSNRVTRILATLPPPHWHHVPGGENPADLVSRGTSFEGLKTSSLWWSGPSWLSNFTEHATIDWADLCPSEQESDAIKAELKAETQMLAISTQESTVIESIIDQHSSLTKIERIIAFCLRFISNARSRQSERIVSCLSIREILQANQLIVKHVQRTHFVKDITELKSQGRVNERSRLRCLLPFLDSAGLLRVGGRLEHSLLPYTDKHPILIPGTDRFSKLLFEREHCRLAHAGPQNLLYSIRQNYWPLKGRNLARQVVHECIRCFRNKPDHMTQVMGQLPPDRVRPQRAFFTSGVDFAGPITTLVNKGRGRKTNKSYIALFICFSTKAIHLEAVSDLLAASFIAAMRRFVGRRGCPQRLFCDNATNFQGAKTELGKLYASLQNEFRDSIAEFCNLRQIEWSFIPPSSPHMGGLWEAGVKSCKFHLRRVVGLSLLTFEELSTLLVQIEACLNSRPLCCLPTTPLDLQPLTPGHLLIGEPITRLPDVDMTDLAVNRLDRWQLVQRIMQDFWKRWQNEYLSSLQVRAKWTRDQPNLAIGDIVIIHEANTPPVAVAIGQGHRIASRR